MGFIGFVGFVGFIGFIVTQISRGIPNMFLEHRRIAGNVANRMER